MRFRRSQGDGTDTFQPRLWLILVGLIAMFLYLLAFISMNDDQINIDFVFFTATVSPPRVGDIEVWVQHLPNRGAQMQLRYMRLFKH